MSDVAGGERYAIVVARFYADIADRLVTGASEVFEARGAHVDVHEVPGAFELPLAARLCVEWGRYDGVACLGCVIRGETDHYDFVCAEAARGIAEVGRHAFTPCAFGVLTVDSREQALERSGGGKRHSGREAAQAVLRMVELRRSLELWPGDPGEGTRATRVGEGIHTTMLQYGPWRGSEGDEPAETVAPATGPKAHAPRSWASVRPASGTAVVDISHGQYSLLGIDAGPRGIRSGGDGLFVSEAGCVYVAAATANGPLLLTVEIHPEPPPLELEGWEDVMEVSQRTDTGEVYVAPLFDGAVEGLPELRVPPGSLIRLRIHARRRDEAVEHADRAFPDLPDKAIEEQLLQLWPSSEAQLVWHRLGSRYGETMRRQWDNRSRDEEPG